MPVNSTICFGNRRARLWRAAWCSYPTSGCGAVKGRQGLTLLVLAAALSLSAALQAKPIDRCVAHSKIPLVEELSSAGIPGVDCASLPRRSPLAVVESTDSTRVLAKASSETAPSQSAGGPSDPGSCSSLRGSHEAKSTMLQSIQRRLSDYESRHQHWRRAVAAMHSSGVGRDELAAAGNRLSEASAVLGVLRAEFLQRSAELNASMNKLTRACLRG